MPLPQAGSADGTAVDDLLVLLRALCATAHAWWRPADDAQDVWCVPGVLAAFGAWLRASALERREAIVIDDTSGASCPGSLAEAASAGWRFALAVPVFDASGAALGCLYAAAAEPRPAGLTDAQRSALDALARQASLRLAKAEAQSARTALADAEERLRLVVRVTKDAIRDWDLRSDHVQWNEALQQAYGHRLADVAPQGAWWFDHIHPDDRERIERGLRAVIDGTATEWTGEYRFRRHDGTYADVKDRGSVVRDSQGRAVRMIGAMLDQSEIRMLVRDTEARAQQLAATVADRTSERDRLWRSTNEMMATAGPHGYLTQINPAWERVLGWSEVEWLGRDGFVLLDPADREATRRAASQLKQGRPVRNFVNRMRTASGQMRTIMWDVVPDGDVFHLFGRDLTEQRAIEDRLRQSQKMEALGQLTGGIAHDFNNLLTGILGALDLVRRDLRNGRSDRLERYMEAAGASAQRAAGLTHRLLTFSRRQSLDVQAVEVDRLVGGMSELLRRTLGETIELAVVLRAPRPARTDVNQLESALLNLAINARDAMPDGGRLTIRTSLVALDPAETVTPADDVPPGEFVAIEVSDTGIGMTPDVLAKVFDPFFTTKPEGQGTGLGLSMIYGFINQSGGHVRIASSVGQGTTVRLLLPRAGGTPPTNAPDPDPEPLATATAPHRVLVVEDDPAVRMLVADVLDSLGYQIVEASDGRSAAKLLQSGAWFDLLISDMGLPGLNGRQVAEIARQSMPTLPVLFVTGYAEQATPRTEILAPGMRMIVKPFAIDTLASIVHDMLAHRGGLDPGVDRL